MKKEKLGKLSERKTSALILISEKIYFMAKRNMGDKLSNYIVIMKNNSLRHNNSPVIPSNVGTKYIKDVNKIIRRNK